MRYFGMVLVLLVTTSVVAGDNQRGVVGKLTASTKPQIRTMSEHERDVAKENLLALNLDVSPDQVICRKVKVSRDSASKLKVQRCKSRAEFRDEAEQRVATSDMVLDNSKYLEATRRQIAAMRAIRQRQVRTK